MSGGKGISGLLSNLGGGLIEGLGQIAIDFAMKGLAKVGSFFKGLFGGESKELKAAKAAFTDIQKEAARLGITLDATFKLKSVEDYQKAIAKAQQQISGFME